MDVFEALKNAAATIAADARISHGCVKSARATLEALARDIEADVGAPPGSKTIVAGATVTHRPDLVLTESQRQAADQGEAGYLPVKTARLAKADR